MAAFSEPLLRPGIKWLQRMRLATKLSVIDTCLLVALGISLFGLVQYSSASIAAKRNTMLAIAIAGVALSLYVSGTAAREIRALISVSLEASASEAQNLDIDKLRPAVECIDADTQQNAAMVEETAAAAGSPHLLRPREPSPPEVARAA